MRYSLVPPFFSFLALLCPVTGSGEDVSLVTTGARVRVVAPRVAERPLIGVLLAVQGVDLILRKEGSADPVVVPRAAITKFEVSRGPKSKAKAALIGGAIGAAAGAILGAAAASPTKCNPNDIIEALACEVLNYDLSNSKGQYIAVGSLAGAGVGALAGTLLAHGEKWQIVSTDKIAISLLTPSARAVAFTVSMRF